MPNLRMFHWAGDCAFAPFFTSVCTGQLQTLLGEAPRAKDPPRPYGGRRYRDRHTQEFQTRSGAANHSTWAKEQVRMPSTTTITTTPRNAGKEGRHVETNLSITPRESPHWCFWYGGSILEWTGAQFACQAKGRGYKLVGRWRFMINGVGPRQHPRKPHGPAMSPRRRCRYTYFYQQLRFVSERPVLTEKRLTQEEYQDMKEQVDPDFELISKHSMSFTYQNQYFELGMPVIGCGPCPCPFPYPWPHPCP